MAKGGPFAWLFGDLAHSFVHPLIDTWVVFCFSVLINNACVSIHVKVSPCMYVFAAFVNVPESEMAYSAGL